MPALESSPLFALDRLYTRLAEDPRYDLARPGYSAQKVSFCILLNSDGSLSALQDERDSSGKKPLPKVLPLPGQAKPSGQGLNPCFLWDNSAYLLGYKSEDEKPERTAKAFAAFRQRHLDLAATKPTLAADPGFAAVCAFLRAWTPENARAFKASLDDFAATGFGVFRLVGESSYVHARPALVAYWESLELAGDPNAARGQCLITGENAQALAKLVEPAIKGVAGAQSSGAKIISFNCDSFTSYGKEQGLNAPVSQASAFRHATALNSLLGGPQSHLHRIQVGDATTVFWTGAPTAFENCFAAFLDGHTPEDEKIAQDEELRNRLRIFFEILRGDGSRGLQGLADTSDTPFYVLGLSPNAARLSIRFWLVDTLDALVGHLRSHYEALRLIPSAHDRDPEFPAPWLLLRQTARESKDIPPSLAAPVLKAILTGAPYPPTLATAVLGRIRADRDLSYLRVAVLKAFLNRNYDHKIKMSLDPNYENTPYQLGRLFAVFEKTQQDALGGINSGIRERFFSSASSTPNVVFGRLIKLHQHHLPKAESRYSERYGPEVARKIRGKLERTAEDIFGTLKATPFPAHLGLEGQSLFALGYYHQRQDFFTKPDTKPAELSA